MKKIVLIALTVICITACSPKKQSAETSKLLGKWASGSLMIEFKQDTLNIKTFIGTQSTYYQIKDDYIISKKARTKYKLSEDGTQLWLEGENEPTFQLLSPFKKVE